MSTHSEFSIRAARAEDRPAVCALVLAAYEQYAAVLGPAGWAEYRQDLLDSVGGGNAAELIVAEQAGAVVGSVLLFPPEPRAEHAWPVIRVLAVAPAARGHGIGTALVEECIRRSRQADYPAVTLHTHEIMAVALRLYTRMGFQRYPALDINVAPGVVIKAFRLPLDQKGDLK